MSLLCVVSVFGDRSTMLTDANKVARVTHEKASEGHRFRVSSVCVYIYRGVPLSITYITKHSNWFIFLLLEAPMT